MVNPQSVTRLYRTNRVARRDKRHCHHVRPPHNRAGLSGGFLGARIPPPPAQACTSDSCFLSMHYLLTYLLTYVLVHSKIHAPVGVLWFYQIKCVEGQKFDIKIAKIPFWMRASTPALPTALPLHPHWERTRRPPFYKCGIPHLLYARSGPA